MLHDKGLRFADWLAAADMIRQNLVAEISDTWHVADGHQLADLGKELAGLTFHGAEPGAPALTVGFVGPYNAGKSSLVRCLTSRNDVIVRADPVSHGFETYDWRGLRFLDTPGIEAGDDSHEKAATSGVRSSDLVLFVTTPNLFDEATAAAFRRITLDERRAPDMLIVVNKALSLGGEPHSILDALLEVAAPLGIDQSSILLTEARDWLDAEDEPDTAAAAELKRRSQVVELAVAIDRLAARQGLTARLTRPLHAMRRIAGDAAALVSAVDPDAERALHLTKRKARILSASEARLKSTVRGIISRVATQVIDAGDDATKAVIVGAQEDDIRCTYDAAVERAKGLAAAAPDLIETEITREWRTLMEQLGSDKLALESRGDTRMVALDDPGAAAPDHIGGFGSRPSPTRGAAKSNAVWYADQIRKFGDFLSHNSSGARTGTGFLTAAGSAGSNTHTWIYTSGKFVGVKFKPWEAVRYAKWAGNAGRVLGVVGGLLALVFTYIEDKREREADRQISTAREEVRAQFRLFAREFEEAGWASLEAFLDLSYGAEQRTISDEREQIIREAATRADRAAPLLALAERAVILAAEIVEGERA